ncbi:hypothetical protein MKX03_005017, partial [Papaver bracteatum]
MSCVGCGGSGAGGDKCYFTSEISNGPQENPQTTTQVLACIPISDQCYFTFVKRVMTQGAVHAIQKLQVLLRNSTSNLTFQEAYDMVGRVLGVTVCSPMKHELPRCLNYLASPHVVIWSVVTAFCAFSAQEMIAKDRSGEIVPYHHPFHLGPDEASSLSVRRWRDGSLESNLLMIQLKELFNVNHFIVCQANSHIAPFLRLKEIVRAYGGNFAAKLAHLAEMEVKHRCHQLLELGFPLGSLAKHFAQDWDGDITVFMPATLAQVNCTEKIMQNPSHVELQKAPNQVRDLALDEWVALLNHMRRLKRSSERATASHGHGLASTIRFNASKRIPSWNCVAGKTQLAGGRSTGKNFRVHLNNHDGSDSDSESIDLNSWTKSDADSELNKSPWTRGEDEVKGVTVSPNIIIQMVSRDSYYHGSSSV